MSWDLVRELNLTSAFLLVQKAFEYRALLVAYA
jgi:hypothetical protein